jgi:hypothetical protein
LTGDQARRLRTVTFGALEGGPWGAAWSTAGSPFLLLAASTNAEPRWTPLAAIRGSQSDEDWQLSGEGVDLEVSAVGEPAEIADDDRTVGFDQLCHVGGRALLGNDELAIDSPGLRGARADVDPAAYGSIRHVSIWFDSGEGIALLALRPRKAKDHSRDIVSAALLEASAATVVAEPRLSTTYTAAGIPARAGLELWLDDEEHEHYPRRAAGESVAGGARLADDGVEVRGQLFRWHRRGTEGAGVYLLARAE